MFCNIKIVSSFECVREMNKKIVINLKNIIQVVGQYFWAPQTGCVTPTHKVQKNPPLFSE